MFGFDYQNHRRIENVNSVPLTSLSIKQNRWQKNYSSLLLQNLKPSRKIGQLSFIQFCKFKLFNYEKEKLNRLLYARLSWKKGIGRKNTS